MIKEFTLVTPIETAATEWDHDELSAAARDHLWMHFTRMSSYAHAHVPTIVRGEGSTVWDDAGNAYLDATASLWYCNVGHGRP